MNGNEGRKSYLGLADGVVVARVHQVEAAVDVAANQLALPIGLHSAAVRRLGTVV